MSRVSDNQGVSRMSKHQQQGWTTSRISIPQPDKPIREDLDSGPEQHKASPCLTELTVMTQQSAKAGMAEEPSRPLDAYPIM